MLTLAATACTGEVAQGICREGLVFMHGPTFMANALACAVAGAALDILDENRWQAQVAGLETAMRRGLEPCRRVSGVEDVRVLGGIGVVETKQPVNTAALQNCFVEQGVWIRPFNRLIYLMPPYVSPIEDVARALRGCGDGSAPGRALRMKLGPFTHETRRLLRAVAVSRQSLLTDRDSSFLAVCPRN